MELRGLSAPLSMMYSWYLMDEISLKATSNNDDDERCPQEYIQGPVDGEDATLEELCKCHSEHQALRKQNQPCEGASVSACFAKPIDLEPDGIAHS